MSELAVFRDKQLILKRFWKPAEIISIWVYREWGVIRCMSAVNKCLKEQFTNVSCSSESLYPEGPEVEKKCPRPPETVFIFSRFRPNAYTNKQLLNNQNKTEIVGGIRFNEHVALCSRKRERTWVKLVLQTICIC